MVASFVIGFHTARIENLLQTLRFLAFDHEDVLSRSQLVLVCQDTCEALPKHQLDELESLRECSERSVLANRELSCMQLPVLTNLGVRLAEAEKVIVLESDRLLPTGYFARVLDELRPGVQITTKKMLKLTQAVSDHELRNGEYSFVEEFRSESNEIGMRNIWSGNTAFMKSDYLKVGGMDERYVGYGWADSDMTLNMQSQGVKSIFRPETELHLWHEPATYGTGDQKQMFVGNGIYFCTKWNKPYPEWFQQELNKLPRKILL